jgi:acetoacetate decarboxylase
LERGGGAVPLPIAKGVIHAIKETPVSTGGEALAFPKGLADPEVFADPKILADSEILPHPKNLADPEILPDPQTDSSPKT